MNAAGFRNLFFILILALSNFFFFKHKLISKHNFIYAAIDV